MQLRRSMMVRLYLTQRTKHARAWMRCIAAIRMGTFGAASLTFDSVARAIAAISMERRAFANGIGDPSGRDVPVMSMIIVRRDFRTGWYHLVQTAAPKSFW